MSATGSTAAEKRARAAAAKRQRRQADPELRAREAEARRKRRLQESTEATRARAAEAQRQRRQANIEAARQREAETKRRRRAADPEAARQRESAAKAAKRLKQLLQPGTDGVDARLKRELLDRSFGHSCKVCDRLWLDKHLAKITSIKNEQSRANAIAVLQREFAADDHSVLLRRCPCGQVLNSATASQASGWVERREVSVQCGLQEMPPLPLPPETFPSAAHGGSIKEGASSDQGGRPSQGFPVLENGTNSGTGKMVERRQQFRCPLCQYKTPRLDNLRCHRLSHCIEKPYKCEVCPAAYKYLNNYKSHMCMHTGEVPFRCDLCPFSTIYHMSLQLHRRTHSDAKPFACTMCPFKSRNKADLRIHIGNHRNNKPFKCKVCSFGYGRKWALKVHMQQQHM